MAACETSPTITRPRGHTPIPTAHTEQAVSSPPMIRRRSSASSSFVLGSAASGSASGRSNRTPPTRRRNPAAARNSAEEHSAPCPMTSSRCRDRTAHALDTPGPYGCGNTGAGDRDRTGTTSLEERSSSKRASRGFVMCRCAIGWHMMARGGIVPAPAEDRRDAVLVVGVHARGLGRRREDQEASQLNDHLLALSPAPIVSLNRAIAIAGPRGVGRALAIVGQLALDDPDRPGHLLTPRLAGFTCNLLATPPEVDALPPRGFQRGTAFGTPLARPPLDHDSAALWPGLGDDLVLCGKPADFGR
jgi:hypothetical protein